jgi:hypothetical protein
MHHVVLGGSWLQSSRGLHKAILQLYKPMALLQRLLVSSFSISMHWSQTSLGLSAAYDLHVCCIKAGIVPIPLRPR